MESKINKYHFFIISIIIFSIALIKILCEQKHFFLRQKIIVVDMDDRILQSIKWSEFRPMMFRPMIKLTSFLTGLFHGHISFSTNKYLMRLLSIWCVCQNAPIWWVNVGSTKMSGHNKQQIQFHSLPFLSVLKYKFID